MSLCGRGVWPGVVVDVALPEVLLVGIFVGLVVVGERWMVVLVGVSSHHVSNLFSRPVVVGNVGVLVLMHDGLVIVVGQRPHLRESTRCRASSLSLSWSLSREWRPGPCRDSGGRAEACADRGDHPVRGGHRAGHRVGPERQAAMAAKAASRTLEEVGRRRRRVTAAPGQWVWSVATDRIGNQRFAVPSGQRATRRGQLERLSPLGET
jgi:hypothetical protein